MKNVVIIGAGIVGATTAYQLAKKGVKVTIIEANSDGRATSAAAGIICPWVTRRRNKDWYALAKNGAAYYPLLINELREDGFIQTGYKKVGAIRLHEDVTKLEELQNIALTRRDDAPEIGDVHMLLNDEVKDIFPLIDDTYAGLFIEGAARVDGRLLRDAMIQAAINYGAVVINGTATLRVDEHNKAQVYHDGNYIQADNIIATNGVWMTKLFAQINLKVEVKAQKGEIIHLQVDEMNTDSLPVIMPPTNQYMLSFDGGRIVIGASYRRVEAFDTKLTVEGTHHILQQALQVAPELKGATIAETRVGFRPFTFNHLPVFGPLPTQPHVMLATGLGASGLTTGPYIGRQLAKLITNEATDLPIEAYNVEQIIR